MSEPISVRTEAIKTLRTLLGQSTGAEGDVALDELNGEISNTNSSVSTLGTSVVDLKKELALLKAQMKAIADAQNVDIDSIEIKPEDAATAEEQAGTAPIKYSVETGTMNTNYFKSDSTHYMKHYTYDNLHVIWYSLITTQSINDTSKQTEVATFTDLSSVPDSGACMEVNKDISGMFSISGNSVYIQNCSSIYTDVAGYFFWFDRNAQSRLFTFEDGFLVGSNVATTAPFYATHAYVGNLHFLTIHTKAITQMNVGSSSTLAFKMAEFPNSLSIPDANMMGRCGFWTGSNAYKLDTIAPDNKTISISSKGLSISINSLITINVMWIDTRAVQNDFTVITGTSTAMTSADKYVKYLKYGHFNFVQAYGCTPSAGISSSTKIVAKFDQAVYTPETNSYPFIQGRCGEQVMPFVQMERSDYLSFNAKAGNSEYNKYRGNLYYNFSYLWFA